MNNIDMQPKCNSVIKLGNIDIYVEPKFNWFQRKMWKILLGLEVHNVLKGESDE